MQNLAPSHVVVALSGGVDSSLTAYLLKEAGHQVDAIFMKNWEDDGDDCPVATDIADAQNICEQLRINFQVINFADQYWSRVFSLFLDEYRAGRTPNPDILCNKEIKFKVFLEYAKERGADYIATGHYARTVKTRDIKLLKGRDPEKDQSYFLYQLDQTQLKQTLFPIGHQTKQEVRALAKKLNLKTHAKKDSTGICFIGERKFKNFLNDYLPATPGIIETNTGEWIGEHEGLMFHTIGQRQGLGIGGQKNKKPLPWYVVDKDLKRNVLIVAQGKNHPALFKNSLDASSIHWIGERPTLPVKLKAKIRYRQAEQLCTVCEVNDHTLRVTFEEAQRAITPGQSVVFYQDDICLGGGIIDRCFHNI